MSGPKRLSYRAGLGLARYTFDPNLAPRWGLVRGMKRPCKHCKAKFIPKRSDAEFCSNLCRQAAYFRRDRKRKEVQAVEIKKQRQEKALAVINQFDRYQSLAGMMHIEARARQFNIRYMATRIGILVVEGGSGAFGHFLRPRYRLPGWFQEIKSRSDSREITALLSQESLSGPYMAKEAEQEFRAVLAQGPTDVSLFVEEWEPYLAKLRANAVHVPTSWADDWSPYDDDGDRGNGGSFEFGFVEGEFVGGDGYQVIDLKKYG